MFSAGTNRTSDFNIQVYVKANGDEPTPVQLSQRSCRVRYEHNSSTVSKSLNVLPILELHISSFRGLFRQMAVRCNKVYEAILITQEHKKNRSTRMLNLNKNKYTGN